METYLQTRKSVLYTASEDETVVIKMWNDTHDVVPELTIECADKKYSDDITLEVGADNEFHDRSHEIKMLEGDKITGYCSIENAIRYEVIKYRHNWHVEEPIKLSL